MVDNRVKTITRRIRKELEFKNSGKIQVGILVGINSVSDAETVAVWLRRVQKAVSPIKVLVVCGYLEVSKELP